MRRPVLTQPDAVMREHVDHALLHQCRQPHRGPHVVGEGEERARVGDHPAMERHAAGDGAHSVLADAKVQIAAARRARAEVTRAVDQRLVARSQVRRAAHQHRDALRENVEHLARGVPRRIGRRVRRE